jgi:hypothetical protein
LTVFDNLGSMFGYWDHAFSTPAAELIVGAAALIVVCAPAWLAWATAWLWNRFAPQRRGLQSPPLDYFVAEAAADFTAMSLIYIALSYAQVPANAPVWAWLQANPSVRSALMVGAIAAFALSTILRYETAAQRHREIFGRAGLPHTPE